MANKFREFTVDEVTKHNKDGDLWAIIDTKVFDLTKFASFHPGGKAVLLDDEVRGQDCTDLFYSLHRSEVLLRPQYARLQIGVITGKTERFKPAPPGSLSPVPYGGIACVAHTTLQVPVLPGESLPGAENISENM